MHGPSLPHVLGTICAAAGLLFSLNGYGENGSTEPVAPQAKIKHIVVIFQENRTPDNLFQDPVLSSRGADIAQSGIDLHGHKVPLSPIGIGVGYDISHSHAAFVKM